MDQLAEVVELGEFQVYGVSWYIYIYMYIYICVCVMGLIKEQTGEGTTLQRLDAMFAMVLQQDKPVAEWSFVEPSSNGTREMGQLVDALGIPWLLTLAS